VPGSGSPPFPDQRKARLRQNLSAPSRSEPQPVAVDLSRAPVPARAGRVIHAHDIVNTTTRTRQPALAHVELPGVLVMAVLPLAAKCIVAMMYGLFNVALARGDNAERDPEAKGLVDRAHGYLERSFLPGRTFAGPADFNAQLRSWLDTVNQRPRRALGCASAARFSLDNKTGKTTSDAG
jgi:hypothetical protein